MPATCQQAATIAEKCAITSCVEYKHLSSLMCWDGVLHVAMLAGVIDETRYKALKGQDRMVVAAALAPMGCPMVLGAAGMGGLPPGQAMIFYDGTTPMHSMISLGDGRAAGNKNDCIGLGNCGGWEILDLRLLNWTAGGIDAPGPHGRRIIQAHYQPITQVV